MESLRLKNVKAFEDTGEISLSPITIFVGQNSCGKSSFLRFPAVLSQTLKDSSRAELCLHQHNAESVDYGSFTDTLHNHSGDSFSVSFNYALKHRELFPFYCEDDKEKYNYHSSDDNLDARVDIEFKRGTDNNIVVSSFSLFINEKPFCEIKKLDKLHYCVRQIRGYIFDEEISVESSFEMIRGFRHFIPDWNSDTYIFVHNISIASLDIQPETQKNITLIWDHLSGTIDSNLKDDASYATQERIVSYISFKETLAIIRAVKARMTIELGSLIYIGPLRDRPQRIYRVDNFCDESFRVQGFSISEALYNKLRISKDLQQEVSNWLSMILDYGLLLKNVDEEYFKVCLIDKAKNAINICDVGYGISQLLPIIIACSISAVSDKYRIQGILNGIFHRPDEEKDLSRIEQPMLIVEQPEIHLHPAAQAKLARLFAGSAVESVKLRSRRKILIETHSEHFIRALQVLVADPAHPLTNDMIKVYYAENDGEQTKFNEMKLESNGQFRAPWPTGFFDRSYQLTRELLQAVAQRNEQQGDI